MDAAIAAGSWRELSHRPSGARRSRSSTRSLQAAARAQPPSGLRTATPVERSRAGSRLPLGVRRLLLQRDAQEPHRLVGVDLAASLAAHPADPDHGEDGDDEGRHEPQQDLHLSTVGTSVAAMTDPTPGRPRVRLVRPARDAARRRRGAGRAGRRGVGRGDAVRRPGARPRQDRRRGSRASSGSTTPPTRPPWRSCARSASGSPRSTTCRRSPPCTAPAPSTIGDAAVVVATASAHRGTAFDASRALIDTLKAEVPIWKHQRFARRHRGVGRVTLTPDPCWAPWVVPVIMPRGPLAALPRGPYRGGHGERPRRRARATTTRSAARPSSRSSER